MYVGLIGNPNVGKSTIFNALTKMRQHTGNWAGKTVESARGYVNYKNKKIIIDDLPGTYSLNVNSKEEEVTKNYIINHNYDVLVIVCDALNLKRNLNLFMQIIDITDKVILCINQIDIALSNGVTINQKKLKQTLNVPIVLTSASKKKNLNILLDAIINFKPQKNIYKIKYNEYINTMLKITNKKNINDLLNINNNNLNKYLKKKSLTREDIILLSKEDIINQIQNIVDECINYTNYKKNNNIDKILTGKITGKIIMLLVLFVIFFITIKASNIISDYLSYYLFKLQNIIETFFQNTNINKTIIDVFINGAIKTTFWVIAVMFPPMAIFFPFFMILEDLGYLPRIAYNLDPLFQKSNSCGKQALTMSMGFGCNAVGVMGCRIIDSQRERLIALLTNSFTPCNGRFPILISIISIFLVNNSSVFLSAIILTLFIFISIIITFCANKILSKTILKGKTSAFVIELPSLKKPQFGKIIIRSLLDKTLFILKRAIIISMPAGILIWLLTNITISNNPITYYLIKYLNVFAPIFGLDGTILLSFILGFPANELVIPIMLMLYQNTKILSNYESLNFLKQTFINNGWTVVTAICTIIFTIAHFPCLTTVWTIKKESNLKWSLFSILIPLIFGLIICFLVKTICNFMFILS